MSELDRQSVNEFVNQEIGRFHQSRLEALRRLNLDQVLKKKNPYLYRAKNMARAGDLVSAILGAYLSSSEEEIFGTFLEELAVFISGQTYGGRKSSAAGIDLEFDRDEARYLVAIKSGTNWGNSSQYAKLEDHFKRAVAVQRQSHQAGHIQPVLGMCYGKSPGFRDTGLYWKVSGQRFWHFLSDDPDLYVEIIEPIGYEAKRHNDNFEQSKAAIENQLTAELIQRFCNPDYTINWPRLVSFNSGNLSPTD